MGSIDLRKPNTSQRLRLCLMMSLMLLLGAEAHAVQRVTVMGLFKDKAVVEIDGQRRVLSVGAESPEGVRLLAASSQEAELEVDGRRAVYRLGAQISTQYSEASETTVQVWPDKDGMYRTVGSINRYPVNFMVDTGATFIAMNANQARRLGIDFSLEGTPGYASTASGVSRMYRITLDSVKVGDIQLRNVDAAVLEGASPREVLLGMSFLGRLKIENQGRAMVLRKMD